MFAAAIFDMDGLLIDSERVIASLWVEQARVAGHALSAEDFAVVVGRSDRESEQMLAALLGGRAAFEQVRGAVAQRFRDPAQRPTFPLKRGASDMLAAVRATGTNCGVASSTAAREIRRRLDAVGILQHFGAFAGGDEVPRGKPDPAVYELVAARLGVGVQDCLAFEDSEAGALAALAAGAQVVLVPDLRPPPSAVVDRSLCVLGSLLDAIDHVPRWFGTGPGP